MSVGTGARSRERCQRASTGDKWEREGKTIFSLADCVINCVTVLRHCPLGTSQFLTRTFQVDISLAVRKIRKISRNLTRRIQVKIIGYQTLLLVNYYCRLLVDYCYRLLYSENYIG